MTKTNAERQAAYRARHLKDEAGELERINMLVDTPTKRALERLAACYGVTQRQVIELALAEMQSRLLATLTSDEQERYYDGTLRVTQ